MTGQYPFRVRVDDWRERPLIAEGRTTIASLLKAQGYRTHMVGKWHLGFKEEGYDKPLPGGPVDRGFDSYFGIRASTDIPPYFYIRDNCTVAAPTAHIDANNSEGWSRIQGAFWREGGIAPDLKLEDVLPRFTQEAISVIESADTQRPFMLYLALPAPHTPWLPAEEFAGLAGAGMYGAFVSMVDSMVGEVIDALQNKGLLDSSLLIFTSDNGPVWLPEDVTKYSHDSSGGLRGMKGDAWESGHRMPFIARWPGKIAAGSTSDQLICFTDLLATFAAITGSTLPAGEGPDSFNFLPVLLGEEPVDGPVRDEWAMQSGGGVMTVRMGSWKLIDGLGSGGFSEPRKLTAEPDGPKGQLYNLADDRAEENNLYLARPDMVEKLQARLQSIQMASQTRP